MVFTGFALYGQANPGGLWYTLTEWYVPLLGGIQFVRFLHHIAAWVFLIFLPIHVYLALRADVIERGGTISSIVSGGRFVPEDHRFVDE
jgi:Ni/Fe-hydrogenase b-type cytochrome subunit